MVMFITLNNFQVKLQDGCPIPMVDMIWSHYCYPEARAWSSFSVSRMQKFVELIGDNFSYVDLHCD